MIFATVGTQLPFDRLIRCLDSWAGVTRESVFAQIGNSDIEFENIKTTKMLPLGDMLKIIGRSNLIVSHAGIGSILTAIELEKCIVVFPRRAVFHEHRNDHQLATARRFNESGLGIYVAFDEDGLLNILSKRAQLTPPKLKSLKYPERLIENLRCAIHAPATR